MLIVCDVKLLSLLFLTKLIAHWDKRPVQMVEDVNFEANLVAYCFSILLMQ